MIEIPLSKTGRYAGKYTTIISDEDADLAELNWMVRIEHKSSTNLMYASNRNLGRIHRVILERMIGRKLVEGEVPDHINRNGLDNRRENLRVATRSENAANRGYNPYAARKNYIGYRGVIKDRTSSKYRAIISYRGKNVYLGSFNTPQEAHAAYCEAALKYHGIKYELHHPKPEQLFSEGQSVRLTENIEIHGKDTFGFWVSSIMFFEGQIGTVLGFAGEAVLVDFGNGKLAGTVWGIQAFRLEAVE